MIKLSENNFARFIPTKSANSFSTALSKSSNVFAIASISKSGNTFGNLLSKSSNKFSNTPIVKNLDTFSGDDTASSPYGGDFPTFGAIYGEENYGGISHFKNRTPPPGIAH